MKKRKTMTALANEYLRHRRKLGYQLHISGKMLLNFARWADRIGHRGPLTVDLAVRWARLPKNASPTYWAHRLEVVRGFAKYRAMLDPATEIPPYRHLGPAHCRVTPYIYSQKEIRELLTMAGTLGAPRGLARRTWKTLLGLLACAGLRISEALRLHRDDLDCAQGLLRIGPTKFSPGRILPLHPTAVAALQRYAHFRDGCLPATFSSAFFLHEDGTALRYRHFLHVFQRLRRETLLSKTPGTRAPRIHDLRHAFACQNLLRWYRQGVDVNHAMLMLSTYLGHKKVTGTYWYLTGIPEVMAVAARRFQQFANTRNGELQ
jgi:integrase